jgi:glycosyltransferase involved in cell wall biosynthesis
MTPPLISLIVPVYDVSKYLRRCLDSLVQQTLVNIEIIIINDCSPDPLDSQICDEYALTDPRVIYIEHKQNLRQGGARNTGLNIAQGEYIWFIDSDDFIDINACEFLYNLYKTINSDIIAFSATSHIDGSLVLRNKEYYYYTRHLNILDKELSGKNFISQALIYNSFYVPPWAYIYKRSLLSNYRFRENVIHEDNDLIPIVIYNAKSVYCIKYAPYYRLIRGNSVTQQEISEKIIIDKCLAVQSLLDYLDDLDITVDDPLYCLIYLQFKDVSGLYHNFNKKNIIMTTTFDILLTSYNRVIEEEPQILSDYERKNIEEIHLNLKRELNTIKQSRLWKLVNIYRRFLKQPII